MRILHTSDWHLGRHLHGYSLHEAQTAAVDQIVSYAIAEKVDAFIVAGDVFDRAFPPVESIRLLNSALTRLHSAGIHSIITAGNHDSGERIAANSNLLQTTVSIIGDLSRIGSPIELSDEHGPVLVYALPYLSPDLARLELGTPENPIDRSHEAVANAAMDRINADIEKRAEVLGSRPRTIVVAHAFVAPALVGESNPDEFIEAGMVISNSEKDLTIGGIQIIPTDVFAGINYVALGHLHGAQVVPFKIDRQSHARYSGSLLRYSLSEINHNKSFVVIDLDASGIVSDENVQKIAIEQPRPMTKLEGSLDYLTSSATEPHRDSYVYCAVTDLEFPADMNSRLNNLFPYLLQARHVPEGRNEARHNELKRVDAKELKPEEVAESFQERMTNVPPTPAELAIWQDVIEKVRENMDAVK